MADKRITELTNEKLTLGDGDYTIVDSNEGAYKYKLKRILDSIPAPDTTLSIAGRAADAKVVGDELTGVKRDLDDKANADGTYDGMTVGSSRQLLSESYLLDEEPYLFRASGGDGSDRVEECIVGGSVAWNQLVWNGNFKNNLTSGWSKESSTTLVASDGVATMTNTQAANGIFTLISVPSEHKVFWTFGAQKETSADYLIINACGVTLNNVAVGTSWINLSGIVGLTGQSTRFGIYPKSANSVYKLKNIMAIDLTALFGSTIADYIYQLEQATAGAGVAWFRKYFPEDYYEYSAPTLRHVEGVSAKEVVGFNQWDGEYEENKYIGDETTGAIVNANGYNVTDFIPVIPNTLYYRKDAGTIRALAYDADKNPIGGSWLPRSSDGMFITPNNARYIRVSMTAANTDGYMVNLSDPTKNGQYEPYRKNIYPLDSSWVGMGIPKLANGKLYFDGDIYPPSGQVERRYVEHTYDGSENWKTSGSAYYIDVDDIVDNTTPVLSNYLLNGSWSGITLRAEDNSITAYKNPSWTYGRVGVRASAYATVADWKTHLASNPLTAVYAVKTPTTEEATPYTALQTLDPNGTEEFVSTGIVPVGHYSKYLENLRSKIEGLPKDFSTLIAPTEKTYKATQNYTVGSLLIVDNILYKVTSAIANGGNITPNTNVTATTLSAVIAAL